MTKKEIKKILMSMRTPENETVITPLLGEIDMMNEKTIQQHLQEIGDTEESVRNFFEKSISKALANTTEKHTPINDMFTYGTNGDCIHLHLPGDFHQMWNEIGPIKTISTINLNLLDAIDRIQKMRDDGFYKFKDKNSIFMISPILRGSELKFLENLDFETSLYKKKDLQDEEFVQGNHDAQLAVKIFGKDHSVGTASLKFEIMQTKDWQEKKTKKVAEFNKQGIVLKQKRQDQSK